RRAGPGRSSVRSGRCSRAATGRRRRPCSGRARTPGVRRRTARTRPGAASTAPASRTDAARARTRVRRSSAGPCRRPGARPGRWSRWVPWAGRSGKSAIVRASIRRVGPVRDAASTHLNRCPRRPAWSHGPIIAALPASVGMMAPEGTSPPPPAPHAGHWFETRPCLAASARERDWDIMLRDGPVIATAIHDGHAIRPSLQPLVALADDARLREEDPLTGLLTDVGDVRITVPVSRFEVDLNRPRDKAVYRRPDDCWGLEAWREALPGTEVARSLARWDRFYAMVEELIERLLERWETVLLIDLHSYNHRRDGADAAPAPQEGNPDIELGLSTVAPGAWRQVADRFAAALRRTPVLGRAPDVRANVRWPTGGHFPEWVYDRWGERVCTISP